MDGLADGTEGQFSLRRSGLPQHFALPWPPWCRRWLPDGSGQCRRPMRQIS